LFGVLIAVGSYELQDNLFPLTVLNPQVSSIAAGKNAKHKIE
jgi:hypothetical protein